MFSARHFDVDVWVCAGELRVIFSQEDVYGEYIDRFFAEQHHPSISWVNDLGKARFSAASRTLLEESRNAGDLEMKHVCRRLLTRILY